jgi:Uma2 family endonuclease
MALNTLIPREEYLRTNFPDPEPDYVKGELVERPASNFFHGRTQIRLADAFKPWEDRKQLFRASEIRLRIGADRFRVADFAVFLSESSDPIPESAPLVVVEIVSPDDRYEEIMTKLEDYEAAGVEYIFVADPPAQRLSLYRRGDLLLVSPALELHEYGVAIPTSAIFG